MDIPDTQREAQKYAEEQWRLKQYENQKPDLQQIEILRKTFNPHLESKL